MKTRDLFKLIGRLGLVQLLSVLILQTALAGSATWNLNPTSGDWNRTANWTPATVPNGPDDIATFATSNNTAVSLLTSVEVNALTFNAGASAFSITSTPNLPLTISGAGVVNNSGAIQTFIIDQDDSADSNGITFSHSASAGTATAFMVMGGEDFAFGTGGELIFRDTATAENGTFEVFGAKADAFRGGSINFWDSSSAGNATFTIHPGGGLDFANTSTLANGTITNRRGQIFFLDDASGGDGTIINSAPFLNGGVFFNSTSTDNITIINNGATSTSTSGYCSVSQSADTGTFINNGGAGSGAAGGITAFIGGRANGANSTLIANGGTGGGSGGQITFSESSDGGMARVELSGNGTLDISEHNSADVTVGSIEGDGLVFLGANDLSVGANNLSTTFSGMIQDGGVGGGINGSLTKIGRGKLALTSANSYTGGTTVEGGTLLLANAGGSNTGTGAVHLNGGRLRGTGIVAGAAIIGDGNGARAFLSPGSHAHGALTIQQKLTLNGDATYNFVISSSTPEAAKVMVKGTIINSGALFSIVDLGNGTIPPGQVFTVIDNHSATPISGVFSNLADGSTITIGSNTFQADYQGGDGNDLTLTVVQ